MSTRHEEAGGRGEGVGARRADEGVRPEAEGTPRDGESPRRRSLVILTAVIFALNGGIYLFSGEWVSAAFFLAVGFFFYKGKEVERWPKAARVVAVVALAALGVAMLVRLVQRLKGLG